MYCTKCGNKIEPEEKFCTNCGNNIDTTNEIKANKNDAPYIIVCFVSIICMCLFSRELNLRVLFFIIALISSVTGYIKSNSQTARALFWTLLIFGIVSAIIMGVAMLLAFVMCVNCVEQMKSCPG